MKQNKKTQENKTTRKQQNTGTKKKINNFNSKKSQYFFSVKSGKQSHKTNDKLGQIFLNHFTNS